MMINKQLITNYENFEIIKKKFILDGKEKMHIISDFDKTLTRAFYEGKKHGSIISNLRNGNYLSEDYSRKANNLYDRYHKIEIDPEIPYEEKKDRMHEWWKAHKELLIEYKLDKETINKCVQDMIETNSLVLREGVEDLFKLLRENNIPLIIITSSLKDLVLTFLKQKNIFSDNIHVIGNEFEYDKLGKAIRVKKIMHILNKNNSDIKDLNIYQELINRKNVILLGDSLGDLGMIEGFEYDNLLKIGFYNEDNEKTFSQLKESYDVVILNHGDVSFVNQFIINVLYRVVL